MEVLTQRDQLLNKVEAIQKDLSQIWDTLRDLKKDPDFDPVHAEKAAENRISINSCLEDMHYHIRNIERNA